MVKKYLKSVLLLSNFHNHNITFYTPSGDLGPLGPLIMGSLWKVSTARYLGLCVCVLYIQTKHPHTSALIQAFQQHIIYLLSRRMFFVQQCHQYFYICFFHRNAKLFCIPLFFLYFLCVQVTCTNNNPFLTIY